MGSNIIVKKIHVEVDKEKKDMFKRQQQCHKLLTKIPIQLISYDVYMRIKKNTNQQINSLLTKETLSIQS